MPGSAASPPHFRPFLISINTSRVWPQSERRYQAPAAQLPSDTNTRAGLPQQHGMIGYCRLHQLRLGKGMKAGQGALSHLGLS